MSKILITYGTRKGASAETARVLGEVLMDQFYCSVDIVNVDEVKPYLQKWREYDGVIIGSSIVAGKWTAKAARFVKKMNIFVSAAGMLNEAKLGKTDKETAIKTAVEKYIDRQLSGTVLKPIAKTAFGGRMIMFGKKKYDNWNKDDIIDWARILGKFYS